MIVARRQNVSYQLTCRNLNIESGYPGAQFKLFSARHTKPKTEHQASKKNFKATTKQKKLRESKTKCENIKKKRSHRRRELTELS